MSSETIAERKALIIGGGIAGSVTAMALQRAGIGSVIYEAYDTSAGLDAGAFSPSPSTG
ncbi:MAG TPA: FAD-dependent monooxygenase [Actinomycetota bacterium]|nr:FAD-dependent monooxygenase [Actinomycetota bacterium]